MAYTGYIPDHLRNKRTDQLLHYRDSLLILIARDLPHYWIKQDAYDRVSRFHVELAALDALVSTRQKRSNMRVGAYKLAARYDEKL